MTTGGPVQRVRAGVLEIAYHEVGPADGPVAVLLHGFPYDAHAYDEVASSLAASGMRAIVPYLRGYGPTRFLSDRTPRSGQQAALGADLLALMDALGIDDAILAGHDWGGRAACIVAALWPERVRGLVSLAGYNIQHIARAMEPAAPDVEHRFWYQWYFQNDRGRAGLAANRRALTRLLWELWSPTWPFDDAAFERTAAAFDNPDFVEVVVHSYRHRFGLAAGDPAYDEIEARLAAQPAIGTPTVVLVGADDGVDPPEPDLAAQTGLHRFTARVELRLLDGVGHNPGQEAPVAFADAVRSLC